MSKLMNEMRTKVNAFSLGHFKEQLYNAQRNYKHISEVYHRKLQDIDTLNKQHQIVLDAAKEELKGLFKKLQKQKKIYNDINKKLTSLGSIGKGKRRKRKTKKSKLKKIYRKKTNKKRSLL